MSDMRILTDSDSTVDRARLIEIYGLPEGRHLRANFISSADGAATVDGRSGGLGNPTDRLLLATLRDLSDVILAGAGTARAERYGPDELTPARRQWRREQGLSDMPRMAVVSSNLYFDLTSSLFNAEPKVLVITHAAAPITDELREHAEVIVTGEDEVDLRRGLDALADRGLERVLCEGGPQLFGGLLAADVVDELCLTVSPTIVGTEAIRVVRDPRRVDHALRLITAFAEDGALFLRYAVSAGKG
jgi:riboflavin biosynthesis pyrimidine reductase